LLPWKHPAFAAGRHWRAGYWQYLPHLEATTYGWDNMSNADDIREFLATRRARLTPREAGLPQFGGSRRVPGLRREEVSLLAGISVEYYTRIERGNARGVSEDVLASITRALQLNQAEHAHLVDLVRVANEERPPRRTTSRAEVRPGIRQIVDAMSGVAAFVRNGRSDVLYANRLFEALYSEMYRDPVRPANAARFLFLDPRAQTFYPDWDTLIRDSVAALRSEAGRNPYDRGLTDLVGLLSTRSEEFRTLWARHDVHLHRGGTKRFRHPLVGDVTLRFETFALPADPGLAVVMYCGEPGSPSEAALRDLDKWATTRERLTPAEASG
jgi:transcriptional regulator with XRE-family HTH domain